MGKLNHISQSLIAAAGIILVTGCSGDDWNQPTGDGEAATVTFRAKLDTGMESRAISDGSCVDKLMVAVYEGDASVESYRTVSTLSEVLNNGVELRLLSGRSYKVLFWAYDDDNTAYSVSDNGLITADYTGYLDGGFAKMEQLDAFYAVSQVSVSGNSAESVTLTRPFAQLNFADNATQPIAGTHKSEIKIDNISSSFNPFTGQSVGAEAEKTFTFADYTNETLQVDGLTYYYVATNYLFVPASGSVSATCRLKNAADGAVVSEHVLPSISVVKNKRTNVLGALVQTPEDIWDGITLTEPTVDSQNRYVIDETSDLAWLAQNGNSLQANRTFVVTKDLDMSNHEIASVQLPAGSTIEGNSHIINNLQVKSGGVFGDVTDLTLKNLTIDKVSAGGATGHIGALVNTLYGNGTFTSVSVKNATVSTSNGAAGGLVGYVVRKSEKDRNEALSVTFTGCSIENTTVSGSASEGVFLGLLSGYDNNETIRFAADCQATNVTVSDYKSPYTEGNEGKWLAQTDYSKYNGWLGDETYYRGTVNYGGNRFVPCWDGVKKVTPLTATDGTKLIYSAFDLAALQGGSHNAVTFKENVDLGGVKSSDPKDDTKGVNRFKPISAITKLDGENHTIYNLYIHVLNCDYWVGGGFILGLNGATSHKNLVFDGAQIIVTHRDTDDDGGARAATLLPTVENGNYTAENIHARNGYVYGVNKMGGLFGYIASPQFNVSGCSVDKYTIENYNSGKKDSFGFLANGEVGGMFGFLSANAEIKNCKVTNSSFKCIGVNNGYAGGIYALAGKVAGRHVNGFIGDIRTTSGQIIKINNCSTSGNSFLNGYRSEDKYSHSYYLKNGEYSVTWSWGSEKKTDETELIGCCYFINFEIIIKDTCGQLYIDDNRIQICRNNP